MAEIADIKRELASRALPVAEMLLPGGRKDGHEFRAGSTAGEAGKSLGVHLTGSKAGIWSDFATGEGGDLIDLWMAAKGLTLPDALDAARDYLGMSRPAFSRKPERSYAIPPKPKCSAPKVTEEGNYLTNERCISGDALRAYRVGESEGKFYFPFIKPNGDLALVKVREGENGAKPRPTSRDAEPILFGWQAIPENARDVVICEGEIDALTWFDYGHPGLSVPFGGGKGAKQQWIENDFERLERFERIYLALDNDDEGKAAVGEILDRLGRHRCYVVELPRKDINECAQDGIGKDVIDACIRDAKAQDPDELTRASDYLDNVLELFWPAEGKEAGYWMPYEKLRGKVLFRPGELTLWTGATGSGKSQVLSDCTVDWIDQGSRVCMASLEMAPAQSLKRMVKQTGGVDRPTEPYLRACMGFIDQGLWLFNRVGKSGVKPLLEVFQYARAKYGCDQFVIDSLMRLGIPKDDYVGQEKAIFEIVDWTIRNNVHVHLVAHARKAGKDRGVPDSEDVGGASEIGSNAFNIIGVWRNRMREDRMQRGTDEEKQEAENWPGVIINVSKQRNGDFEGKANAWFDQVSYRYRTAQERREYVKYRSEEVA